MLNAFGISGSSGVAAESPMGIPAAEKRSAGASSLSLNSLYALTMSGVGIWLPLR